jgi:hypothetical protein
MLVGRANTALGRAIFTAPETPARHAEPNRIIINILPTWEKRDKGSSVSIVIICLWFSIDTHCPCDYYILSPS